MKAAFDFDYLVSAYDSSEEDLCKVISFKKGDKLPEPLVIKFKIKKVQMDDDLVEVKKAVEPEQKGKVNKLKPLKK